MYVTVWHILILMDVTFDHVHYWVGNAHKTIYVAYHASMPSG